MIMNEAEKLGREKFHTGLLTSVSEMVIQIQHAYQYEGF